MWNSKHSKHKNCLCYISKLLRLWPSICLRCLGLYHFDLLIYISLTGGDAQ